MLLSLNRTLIVCQVPLLVLQQIEYFIREQLHVLHHIPQVLRVHRYIVVPSLTKTIRRKTSGVVACVGRPAFQVRGSHGELNINE